MLLFLWRKNNMYQLSIVDVLPLPLTVLHRSAVNFLILRDKQAEQGMQACSLTRSWSILPTGLVSQLALANASGLPYTNLSPTSSSLLCGGAAQCSRSCSRCCCTSSAMRSSTASRHCSTQPCKHSSGTVGGRNKQAPVTHLCWAIQPAQSR